MYINNSYLRRRRRYLLLQAIVPILLLQGSNISGPAALPASASC